MIVAARILCVLALATGSALPQIQINKPLHVRHVQGYVTDDVGKAVVGAKVQLLRDGKPVLGMSADKAGWFRIEGASGRYILLASAGVTEAGHEVLVGTNPFWHKTLYVMVRTAGDCSDCAIQVFTTTKQFFDVVWRNTGHYY